MAIPPLLTNPLLEPAAETTERPAKRIIGTEESDTLTGNYRKNVIKSKAGDDLIFGRKGDDEIYAGKGSNKAYGGQGNDYITATPYESTDESYLFGGAGNDRFYIEYRSKGLVQIHGGKGRDEIRARGDEVEAYGGAGKDYFYYSLGDSNTLFGGRGDDTFAMDDAPTTITGGAGADRFLIRNRTDEVTITDFTSGEDLLSVAARYKLAMSEIIIEADGEDTLITLPIGGQIRLLGINPDDISAADFDRLTTYGTVEDDTLEGSSGRDKIYGSGGDDHISGGDGKDFLSADRGDNTLFGGGGNDDLFGGRGSDTMFGGEGNDDIYSFYSSGVNHAFGGAGNDYFNVSGTEATVEGGTGDDEILCTAESSTLVYNGALDEGADTIFYFSVDTDTLQLSDTTFDDLLIEKAGKDTKISLTSGTEITLHRIDPDEITQDIFDFV
ncbi:MAG: calcium-binding protein [Rhodobacteraceae bacterium]|nr:calcium-binding protein [Paracoccaceae bacterium]